MNHVEEPEEYREDATGGGPVNWKEKRREEGRWPSAEE